MCSGRIFVCACPFDSVPIYPLQSSSPSSVFWRLKRYPNWLIQLRFYFRGSDRAEQVKYLGFFFVQGHVIALHQSDNGDNDIALDLDIRCTGMERTSTRTVSRPRSRRSLGWRRRKNTKTSGERITTSTTRRTSWTLNTGHGDGAETEMFVLVPMKCPENGTVVWGGELGLHGLDDPN